MRAFFYDGTLEGLFSGVFDAYTRKEYPDIFLQKNDIPSLLVTTIHTVATNEEKFTRVFNGLRSKLSLKAMGMIFEVWFSEERGSDGLLYRFIRKVFDEKSAVEHNLADTDILAVVKTAQRVRNEAHLLRGFTRFEKTASGVYFATIGPRHNVLPYLLPHFVERFPAGKWSIYDEQRKYGFLYDDSVLHEIHMESTLILEGKLQQSLLAKEEMTFQDAWKKYCNALVIKERKNLQLQRSCMPRHFWKYMTEKQEIKSLPI